MGLKRVRIAFAGISCLCAVVAAHAQTKDHPDFVAGVEAWRGEQYDVASQRLSSYRLNVAFSKTFDVDYMLGTSWCRLPGKEAVGHSLLDWVLQQALPNNAVQLIQNELTICRSRVNQAAPVVPPQALARVGGGSASAFARGKVFYSAGGKKGSISAYPLELVSPKDEQEYTSRLVPLSEPDVAVGKVKKRLPGFRVIRHGRFVLASKTHSEAGLTRIGTRLEHFSSYLETNFGAQPATSFITVVLSPTPKDLSNVAMELHGLKASTDTLGYAFQNDLSVVAAMQGTAAGTLLHELFHLAVRTNFADVPAWMDEGFASLFETSSIEADRYFGQPNWRGKVLSEHEALYGAGSLRKLFAAPSEDSPGSRKASLAFDPNEAAYYSALGRYFAIYLQQQRKLESVYLAFKDKPLVPYPARASTTTVSLIEREFQRPLEHIESDFRRWLPDAARQQEPWSAKDPATHREYVDKETEFPS